MSERTERASRRHARRAVGAEACEVIDQHTRGIGHLLQLLTAQRERVDALEVRARITDEAIGKLLLDQALQRGNLDDLRKHAAMSFLQRLRWLVRGL